MNRRARRTRAGRAHAFPPIFLDASAQDIELRGIAATASLQTNGLTPAEKYKQDRALRDAVDLHRAAEDMLEIKGSYFPR